MRLVWLQRPAFDLFAEVTTVAAGLASSERLHGYRSNGFQVELSPEPRVSSMLDTHKVIQCLRLCQLLMEHSLKVLLCFEFRGGTVTQGIVLGDYDG